MEIIAKQHVRGEEDKNLLSASWMDSMTGPKIPSNFSFCYKHLHRF